MIRRYFNACLLYPLIERLQHRRIRSALREVRLRASLDFPHRRQGAVRQLVRTLQHARHTVPYYRDLFHRIRFDPACVQSDLRFLRKIPFLTKAIIRREQDRLLSTDFPKATLHERKTGGSTGPSVMIYHSHLDTGWGLGLAFVYLICGAFRLARFNTISLNDEKNGYYLGVPIPVAAVCLTQYIVFEGPWKGTHSTPLVVLLVLFLSLLMVSRFDYDSMPNFRATGFGERFKQAYFVSSVGFIIYDADNFFFPLTIIYLLSGIYRWVVSLFQDEVTQHA